MTHIKTIMAECFFRGKVQALIGFDNYDEALRIAEERNNIIRDSRESQRVGGDAKLDTTHIFLFM